MSVSRIDSWRTPGCGPLCWPRSHDPREHEAHGRRLEREAQARREQGSPTVIRTGALVIDLDARTARVDGLEVNVPPRPWELLVYLAEHLGCWCRNDDTERAIRRAYDSEGGWSNTFLNVNRWRLRESLGEAGYLIEAGTGGALRGIGRTRLVREEPRP